MPNRYTNHQVLRGWAKKRDLKKKGKGRPVHIYKLTKPLPNILKNFEQEKMKQVETIKNDLTELHDLIKGYKQIIYPLLMMC